jgi:hypothetical protein
MRYYKRFLISKKLLISYTYFGNNFLNYLQRKNDISALEIKNFIETLR